MAYHFQMAYGPENIQSIKKKKSTREVGTKGSLDLYSKNEYPFNR